MTNSEILIAKRLVREMRRTAENADQIAKDTGGQNSPLYKEAMHFFMGMGLTLAICFEEMTGKQSQNLKPQEIMQWAENLPAPMKRRPLEGSRIITN